jgi:hypothetical protein
MRCKRCVVLLSDLGAAGSWLKRRRASCAQVLFEAVGLVILLERDRDLVEQMAVQLGRFITAKEPNTRCA